MTGDERPERRGAAHFRRVTGRRADLQAVEQQEKQRKDEIKKANPRQLISEGLAAMAKT